MLQIFEKNISLNKWLVKVNLVKFIKQIKLALKKIRKIEVMQ
jgi:hypothetical protein